jgi:hypothetical protein
MEIHSIVHKVPDERLSIEDIVELRDGNVTETSFCWILITVSFRTTVPPINLFLLFESKNLSSGWTISSFRTKDPTYAWNFLYFSWSWFQIS